MYTFYCCMLGGSDGSKWINWLQGATSVCPQPSQRATCVFPLPQTFMNGVERSECRLSTMLVSTVFSYQCPAFSSLNLPLTKRTALCSQFVCKKRQSGIIWYLPFVFFFNLLIIVLPPYTLSFFESWFSSLCFLWSSLRLNPLPLFYLKPCPFMMHKPTCTFYVIVLKFLLPSDQESRTASHFVVQIFPPLIGCFLLQQNQSVCDP